MVRLTRVQRQERTRAAVLDAARTEFAECGYADAKIDRIAERAELTRGAVYSNFPSKRALYLAVLVDSLDAPGDGTDGPPDGSAPTWGTPATGSAEPDAAPAVPAELDGALGAFARVWLERLPLAGDSPAGAELRLRGAAGLFDDERGRGALAQVTWLEALLLGLALEAHAPDVRRVRRVRLAELVLTLLNGAGRLAGTAPGFGDPFDVARACRHLAGLDLDDAFDPPHLPFAVPATAVREGWEPPGGPPDEITGRPADLGADGVVAVLGTGRLRAAEEAVRAARPGDRVTVAVVTADPAEVGRLVRLRAGDMSGCLRRAFAPGAWPRLRLVLDEDGAVAAAAGVTGPGDDTEVAVRVRAGEIVARADGRGAGHAVASIDGTRV